MDEDHADDLLETGADRRGGVGRGRPARRALPLCETLTVVFHGRRDLGTIQTYVAHGGRGAGAAVAADELLRVPCDLDLAAAEDREEAERLYAEQAAAMRDALVGADTVLDIWREPLEELAHDACEVDRRIPLDVRLPAHRLLPDRAGGARAADRRHRRVRRPAARRGPPADGHRLRASRTSRASTRCPTTRSAAWRTSSSSPPSTRARWPSSSAARRRRCSASSSSRARTSRRPADGRGSIAGTRRTQRPAPPRVLIAVAFAVFVFLGVSRAARPRAERRRRRARRGARRRAGRGARRRRRACSADCRRARRARLRRRRRARRAASSSARARSKILPVRAVGAGRADARDRHRPRRLARRHRRLPVVQCVRVRRDGPLTGGGVELLSRLGADRRRGGLSVSSSLPSAPC